jgi:hypothetical protein
MRAQNPPRLCEFDSEYMNVFRRFELSRTLLRSGPSETLYCAQSVNYPLRHAVLCQRVKDAVRREGPWTPLHIPLGLLDSPSPLPSDSELDALDTV